MAEAPIMDINGWKAPEFRQKIVAKLDEVMRNTGPYMGKTGSDWESHLFPKAKSKEEYLSLIAKLIQHLQSFAGSGGATGAGGSGGGMPGVGQDPINALQTLTKQGPLPAGMVMTGGQPGMGGPGAMGGPGPMGPMSARVQFGQFVGHPTMQGRPMGPQGGPRNEMFLVQQPPMGGMVRAGGQPNYVMMPQFRPMMQQHQQMTGVGGMPYPNALDVPSMGAVPSPAMAGSGPGSVSMVSPGMMVTGQSPGPVGILPSPASAPSPGSALNTPGNPGSVGTHNEEQAYLEKWNQLQKYVEPLKRMINRIDKDEDRQRDLNKMKNLLDILSDSTKRLPYTTLLKCETVLEKLEFSNKAAGGGAGAGSGGQLAVVPPLSGPSEHMCQQLLDTVANHLKSPTLNHTLQRTFGPAVRALHGPPLRTDSPPAKRLCADRDTDDVLPTQDDDISDIIQCEVARLHRRFIVSLDPSHHPGSKVVHLLCRLEDKKLPSVPPIMVTLPESYPDNSPSCRTLASQYESTPFLRKVNEILTTEMKHMAGCYSLTALLNMWDICVRKACAPAATVA